MPQQHLLSRHTVTKPIDVDQTVLCSPHELIAIVTYAHDVVVYRLNGQVAFTIKNSQDEDDIAGGEEPLRVTRMAWSPDGRRLAIAWNDGCWRLHEAEKGETIFQATVSSEEESDAAVTVTGILWQDYGDLTGTSETKTSSMADLPRTVALLDVTSSLPRLCALPSHGLRSSAESTRFSDQAATDSVFATGSTQPDKRNVEVLLLYTSAGMIHVMLNGTSHTGVARCSSREAQTLFAADSRTAYSLNTESGTLLETLQLPVQELSGPVLHFTSSAVTQMNALMQYINRTMQCISHDYSTGTAQPGRFTKNISTTLDDNLASNSNLVSALLQLLMTGQLHADLLEWLTDIVKDVGLRRWDTSVSTMYNSIQTHLHQHILPALERLTIAASRLRGLARLYQGSEMFAPAESLFTAILQNTDALRTTVLQVLEVCITELSSWRVFSKWLKVQIDVALAGPNTRDAMEIEERESLGVDYGIVAKYIRTVLAHGSALKQYVEGGDDLRSQIKIVQSAVITTLSAITAWQGRLFSDTTAHQLIGSTGNVVDMRISEQGLRSTITLLQKDAEGLSIRTQVISTPADAATYQEQRLPSEAQFAAFYGGAEHILAVLPSKQAGAIDLISMTTTAEGQNTVKRALDPGISSPIERMQVKGRPGKEFVVFFGQGGKSWSVHDLRAALLSQHD